MDGVSALVYDVTTPIDRVFQVLEELTELSEAAHAPFTQVQVVNMGYVILNRTGRFRQPIIKWRRRHANARTWVHFKNRFRQASRELESVTDRALFDTTFNQANLVQEIVDNIRHVGGLARVRFTAHLIAFASGSSE